MRNNRSRLIELTNEYEVRIQFEQDGCIVYYINTQETDVIPYTNEIDVNYILDNFEMVADFSKLQMNVHQLQY
jgi:hypothetical protein